MTNNTTATDVTRFLKQMSTEEFLKLGIRDIAYICPIKGDTKTTYAIRAADGTTLKIEESMDMALTTVMQNDLAAITIH